MWRKEEIDQLEIQVAQGHEALPKSNDKNEQFSAAASLAVAELAFEIQVACGQEALHKSNDKNEQLLAAASLAVAKC